jgi:MFS family permease
VQGLTEVSSLFHGWRVVGACFVIAAMSWSLGLFGSSVYLQAVTSAHEWPIAEVASAITVFFLVSASIQRVVGRSIDRFGPRPVLLLGLACMVTGVALIGQAVASWQLYPCFVLLGFGWSTLSMTGITTTVAPWFERYQGRSMTLAIMGASVGAIAGVPLLLFSIAELGLARGLIAASVVAVGLLAPLIAFVLRHRGPADLGLPRDGEVRQSDSPTCLLLPIATPGNRRLLLGTTTVAFALGLAIQIGFITHHVALAEPLLGRAGAGMLVSASGAAAFVGRLILARIVDRVNARRLGCYVMLAQAGSLLAIAFWPNVPVLIVASLVYGYGIGHVTTLGPVVVRREFGAAAFGTTYGTAATAIQLTSALGPAMFGYLRDGFGGYGPGFAIAAIVTLIGCGALFVGDRAGAIVPAGSSGVKT